MKTSWLGRLRTVPMPSALAGAVMAVVVVAGAWRSWAARRRWPSSAARAALLSAATFEDLIAEHTDQLVEEADLFAEGDYAAAYATGRDAFAHSGVLGDYLARAIADQFPDLFPDTAARESGPDLPLLGLCCCWPLVRCGP
jgi:hypothetical protein